MCVCVCMFCIQCVVSDQYSEAKCVLFDGKHHVQDRQIQGDHWSIHVCMCVCVCVWDRARARARAKARARVRARAR